MAISWTNIHSLIHSMTPAEKAHFKKQQSGFSGAKEVAYLALFNAVAIMEPFSDQSLKKVMKDMPNSPFSLRNFMMEQILKSLRSSHRSNHLSAELREMLDKIAILNARGLHQVSIVLIEKALAITRANGMSAYRVLFLIEKRQQLLFYTESVRAQQAEAMRSELLQTTKSQYNNELIKETHLKAIHWRNVHLPLRNKEVYTQVTFCYDQMNQIDDSALGQNEYNLKYAALSILAALLENPEQAIRYQEKTITLMENLDLHKMNRVMAYAAALYNITTLCLYARDSNKAKIWLHKLRHLESAN